MTFRAVRGLSLDVPVAWYDFDGEAAVLMGYKYAALQRAAGEAVIVNLIRPDSLHVLSSYRHFSWEAWRSAGGTAGADHAYIEIGYDRETVTLRAQPISDAEPKETYLSLGPRLDGAHARDVAAMILYCYAWDAWQEGKMLTNAAQHMFGHSKKELAAAMASVGLVLYDKAV